MKNHEFYFSKKIKICFSALVISFILHFLIVFIFYNEIINPGGGIISGAKKNIILGVSYIGPLLFAMFGLKISWALYEEFQYSKQYYLYLILMLIFSSIIFGLDKFIFNFY